MIDISKEQVESMEPSMVLSIINMKLRDYYPDLDSLCQDLKLDSSHIEAKLEKINYFYDLDANQFISKEK